MFSKVAPRLPGLYRVRTTAPQSQPPPMVTAATVERWRVASSSRVVRSQRGVGAGARFQHLVSPAQCTASSTFLVLSPPLRGLLKTWLATDTLSASPRAVALGSPLPIPASAGKTWRQIHRQLIYKLSVVFLNISLETSEYLLFL